MEKPATVALDDLRKKIWGAINEVMLPATIIEPVVWKIYQELVVAGQQELEFDRKTYTESLRKEAEKESENQEDNEDSESREPREEHLDEDKDKDNG